MSQNFSSFCCCAHLQICSDRRTFGRTEIFVSGFSGLRSVLRAHKLPLARVHQPKPARSEKHTTTMYRRNDSGGDCGGDDDATIVASNATRIIRTTSRLCTQTQKIRQAHTQKRIYIKTEQLVFSQLLEYIFISI